MDVLPTKNWEGDWSLDVIFWGKTRHNCRKEGVWRCPDGVRTSNMASDTQPGSIRFRWQRSWQLQLAWCQSRICLPNPPEVEGQPSIHQDLSSPCSSSQILTWIVYCLSPSLSMDRTKWLCFPLKCQVFLVESSCLLTTTKHFAWQMQHDDLGIHGLLWRSKRHEAPGSGIWGWLENGFSFCYQNLPWVPLWIFQMCPFLSCLEDFPRCVVVFNSTATKNIGFTDQFFPGDFLWKMSKSIHRTSAANIIIWMGWGQCTLHSTSLNTTVDLKHYEYKWI